MKLVGLLSIPLAAIASLMGLVVMVGEPQAADASTACVPPSPAAGTVSFDDEQLTNAVTIIEIGRSRGVPPRGWIVALAAAMQESSLRNLPNGDRDSAGLFQMRPSQGWGDDEQVTDPTYAATAFFGGPDVPPANPGLLDISDWRQLTVAEAAQAVERSAHPDAYARWEDDASELVRLLASHDIECPVPAPADCPPSGLTVETGLTPDAVRVVRCAVAHHDIDTIGGLATGGHVKGSDHYTGRAADLMIPEWQTAEGTRYGDRVAAYFVSNADDFGITYIIWRGRIWSSSRPTWRPYAHPAGRADPTALHMDHLHISVAGAASTTVAKENPS